MIVNKSKKNFYFVESGAEDALFVATKCRCNKKILEYLMENGFNDANKPYENGKTAFMLAVENDNDEIIKLFLEKCEYIGSENATKTMKEYYNNFGAFDINLITNGKPRLHHAISENDVLLLKFLIQKGADIFLKDSMEKLPLSSARKNNLHEIVEILMSHNADNLTFIDREKNSPLHLAARQENFDAVKSLLKSGAYYNIENIKGETPKSMAKKNEEVENLFKG
uniref:Ankyrin repeat protein n=1 Tax=Panagrolaimus davidi TaxID=227884 RepID=A0A914PGY2_9BILA